MTSIMTNLVQRLKDAVPVVEGDSETTQTTSTRPACSDCGGPNFSSANDRCIACRLFL